MPTDMQEEEKQVQEPAAQAQEQEHGKMMSAVLPALFFLCNFTYLTNNNHYNHYNHYNADGG